MKDCCVKTLEDIRNRLSTGRPLKALLAISPFVLVLDDLNSPPEMLAKQLLDLAVEKAVEKIKRVKAPELADAVKSVDTILRDRVRTVATLHAFQHMNDNAEYRFWTALAELYR